MTMLNSAWPCVNMFHLYEEYNGFSRRFSHGFFTIYDMLLGSSTIEKRSPGVLTKCHSTQVYVGWACARVALVLSAITVFCVTGRF